MRDSYFLFIAFSGRCYTYTAMEAWKAYRPAEGGIFYLVTPGLPDELLFTWASLSLKSGVRSKITEGTFSAYLSDDRKGRRYYRQKVKCRVTLSEYVYFWLLDETRLRMALRQHKTRRWLGHARKKVRDVSRE